MPQLDTLFDTFRRLWAEVLGLDHTDDEQNFFDCGGDSLLAVRLISRCREHALTLTAKDIFTLQNLGPIASYVCSKGIHAAPPPSGGIAVGRVTEATNTFGLLPAQQRWVDGPVTEVDHFNLGWVFYAPAQITTDQLRAALIILLQRQEALRTAYRQHDTGWTASLLAPDPDAVLGRAALPDYREQPEALAAEFANAQRSMRIADGQVFRLLHLPFVGAPGRLLVLAHHLTLDGFSLSILADELECALHTALGGSTPDVAPTAQPHRYAAAVAEWVAGPEAAADAQQWLALPWEALQDLPTERSGPGRLTSIRTLTGAVSVEHTRALAVVARRHGLGLSEILLGAAVGAISEWADQGVHAVDVYQHGRDITPLGIDVMRTVAYVQNTFPVLLRWTGAHPSRSWFAPLVQQFQALPQRRFGFDALRYTEGPSANAACRALPRALLRYNFRGQMARLNQRSFSLLQPAPESIGQHRSAQQTERYLLMLEGDVIEGSLVLGMKFSEDHYAANTIRGMIERAVALLCQEAEGE